MPLFALPLLCCACKENPPPSCELNPVSPGLVWQASVFQNNDMVLPPFVYGDHIGYATGFTNTQLTLVNGTDGHDSTDYQWYAPRLNEGTWLEGDYLYWTLSGDLWRRHLPSGAIELLGSIGPGDSGSGEYTEGLAAPFEGLVAGSFREKSMTDRDFVIGVFDMASQRELFRYQVYDSQITTNLGDPVLGRTATGDTVLAFVETTRRKLLIFNLSTQDSVQVELPAGENYFAYSRNIYLREGRIFLGLRASVYCFDAATGAQIWKRQEGDLLRVSWLRFKNNRLLFNSNNQHLYALDPVTGNTIWDNEIAGRMGTNPHVWENTLFYTDMEVQQPILHGIDLDTGCTTTRFDGLIKGSGGLIGITSKGYFIIYTGDLLAAYSL